MYKTILIILISVLVGVSGCGKKIVEGKVVSVPVIISLEEAVSGEINELRFSGNTVTVKLSDGKEVGALATKDQMEQAFMGKNKATLEKIANDQWKVINLK